MLKSTMTYGALTGGLLVILSAIINMTGQQESPATWIAYFILALGILWGTKQFRDKEQHGLITYSRALGHGTLTALFSSIITGFFVYLFFQVIAPEKLSEILENVETKMLERNPNMPDDQREMALNWTRKFMTPGVMFFATILSYTFMGFLISLITSSIIKRNSNPFENNDSPNS